MTNLVYSKTQIKKNRAQWLRALESGKYKQTDGMLKRYNESSRKSSYCCLGVSANECGVASKRFKGEEFQFYDLSGEEYADYEDDMTLEEFQEQYEYGFNESGALPIAAQEWLGFDGADPHINFPKGHEGDTLGCSFASLNDGGWGFLKIAAAFRKYGVKPEYDLLADTK